MLIDIRQSKNGETMVVTDPGGDVHICSSAEELWETVKGLASDPNIPTMEVEPGPKTKTKTKTSRRAEADEDDDGDGDGDDEYEDPDDLVAAFAGRAVQGLLGGLQRASFRGKKRKRKTTPASEGDSG